jgi:nicotinate-nucleotide adenylyltransferase
MKRIGVFGGTFDPVHNAHIQMAVEAKQALSLDEVRLIPCHKPPHRDTPAATSEQRLALLQLAVTGCEGLVVDDREIRRDTASYTIDTLLSLRQELGDQVSIVFLLGMDAFVQLHTWHRWQALRDLAHIAVMSRPNSAQVKDAVLQEWVNTADDTSIVGRQAAGGLTLLSQSLLAVSATGIRQQLSEYVIPTELPLAVAQYIKEQGLYQ